MNQIHPRCELCGENPRIKHERHEEAPTYAPLCEECYLEDLRAKPPQAGPERQAAHLPKKRENLLEWFVCRFRYAALGLAVASVLQLPVMFLNGTLTGVTLHSILIAISVPWAVTGFMLSRMKR